MSKKMKKITGKRTIFFVAMLLILSLACIPAYAQSTASTTKAPKPFKNFRAIMKEDAKEKRQVLVDNRKANKAIIEQNKATRQEIKKKLDEIKQSNKKLDEATKTQLQDLREQIKSTRELLAAKKGSIRQIVKDSKADAANGNYDSLDDSYNQIIAIQKERKQYLTQINEDLTKILEILNKL